MKKLIYLIVLALILGLVLTGCSLLSNISQVPATDQSGITYLMKGGLAPDPSLVGLWHFDTDANDSTAYHNDGMLIGDAHLNTGYFGNAVSFDGTNGYVKIADAPSLNITQGTWEAWIKFDVLPSVAKHPMNPLAKANQYWIHGSFKDMDSLTTDAIVVKICVDGKRYCAKTGSDFIDVDVWYHVAGTYDGQTLNLYVNGALVDSNEDPSGNIDFKSYIMAVGTWSTLTDYFQGAIDEVRIWDRALTDAEIAYNYSLGNIGIDIKPGSDPNSINLGSKGVIPVAILGSDSFNVDIVDPLTVKLAGSGVKIKGNSGNAGSLEDVNGDGYPDLVVQVYTENLGLATGAVNAVLNAYTYAGPAITGSDWIQIVPPK